MTETVFTSEKFLKIIISKIIYAKIEFEIEVKDACNGIPVFLGLVVLSGNNSLPLSDKNLIGRLPAPAGWGTGVGPLGTSPWR